MTGWTRLSPTSIYFQTTTQGHVVLVSNGRVQVQVVEAGNITFTGGVCANNAECAPAPTAPPRTPPPLHAPHTAHTGARRCALIRLRRRRRCASARDYYLVASRTRSTQNTMILRRGLASVWIRSLSCAERRAAISKRTAYANCSAPTWTLPTNGNATIAPGVPGCSASLQRKLR